MEPSATGFSPSVQRVAAELAGRDVTAWELAGRLLALHPEHGRADDLGPFLQNGPRRSVEQWLALVAGVAADPAVDPSGAMPIDTRATLLALGRLEPELGAILRSTVGEPPEEEARPVEAPEPADTLRSALREAARRGVVPAGTGGPTVVAPPTPAPEAALPPASAPAPRAAPLAGWRGVAAAVGAVAVAIAAARWLFGAFALAPEPVAAGSDDVEVTVFAPPSATPGSSVLVQAFVHLPDEADDARAIAAELDAGARRRAYRTLAMPVAERARLDFELRAPGLAVGEPVASLVWRRRTEAVQFALDVPTDAGARSVVCTLDVSLEGAPVGHVKFVLQVEPNAARTAAEPQGEQAHAYAYAFISYSSADRDEVLARVQMLSVAGIPYFQDVTTLEPGDRWERRLEAGIDRCDLFLLFWSDHAKSSTWVKREVDHALARQAGNDLAPPEIRPVILERVPPWEELSHLHFDDRVLYFMRPPDPAQAPSR